MISLIEILEQAKLIYSDRARLVVAWGHGKELTKKEYEEIFEGVIEMFFMMIVVVVI